MKRILCYLAQRGLKPAGLLAGHVSRCPECEEFFDQVSALESRLVASAGNPDPDLCALILSEIRSRDVEWTPRSKESRFFSPALLSGVAAAVIMFMSMLTVIHFRKSTEVVDLPPTPAPALPEPAPRQVTLSYSLQQQEFLRRDVQRLGAHLREHSILFQTADQ